MSHLLFTKFRIAYWSSCAVWCLFFMTGCITTTQLSNSSANKSQITTELIQLKSIDIKMSQVSIDVLLNGSGKIKYSAVKQDFPLGVMVYLHDAIIADTFIKPSVPEDIAITTLDIDYADDSKNTVEVKILLKDNLTYQVQEKDSVLTIIFYKQEEISVSDDQNLKETDIFGEKESTTTIASQGNLSSNETGNQTETHLIGSKRSVVTSINFNSGDEGETSIIVNTSSPVRYDMQRNEYNNELQLNLYNTDIPEHHQRQLITTYFNSAVDKIIPIDRSGNETASRIHIGLREKVPYHILQEQNRLTLFLEPSSLKPMKFEGSAPLVVSGSTSVPQSPSLPDVETNSSVVSSQNIDTSISNTANKKLKSDYISPKVDKKESEESQDDSEPEDLEVEQKEGEPDQNEVIEESQNGSDNNFFDETPVYIGEEISLDFYETDIRNVFRILQSVSGDNFAVDKDVTGTVTMTLEKPAPWDEILDLILKMNGLGKIKEGSIVRIATMQTIKREQDEKAALFAARAQALEQKKQQEPMFTEYIPINYANADADIKPHIEKLLTPPRDVTSGIKVSGGTISIDKRTNMVILTDTKSVINQAKELIYTLDKVTPQILISARIVEVTKDFSDALGVDWGLTDAVNSPSIYREDMGGIYGFDIAMNHPVAANASIGYTFARLAGTPLLLDARLTASEATNDLKVISSPKVLTLDNKEAMIKQGVQYPYEKAATTPGGVPTTEFKDVDLSLTVKPQVTPDRRIGMTIKIEKNELAGLTSKGEPYISTSEANTELLVNDGNTIVIGGIVKSSVAEGKTGFPLLSDIPYLGQLFRSNTSKDNKSELLIFITPTIVQLEQKDNKLK